MFQVESRLNNGANAAAAPATGMNARIAQMRLNKASEVQIETPPSLPAPVDASAQRARELLRQRLERVKQGILE